MNMKYSVAIRTIGTAGEKYDRLLRSIARQTVQPEQVIVVLPEGVSPPSVKYGFERYVYSPKGMVAQRIKALDYITDAYTLFCDDDVELSDNFAELLINALNAGEYSAVSGPLLSFFPPGGMKYAIASLMGSSCVMVFGRKKNYTRILKTGGWSYNRSIMKYPEHIYNADSLAWTCFMIDTEVFKRIHLEHEIWLSSTSYAAYDDQTMFYKLRINGFKIGVIPKAKYLHNDAKTSKATQSATIIYARAFNHYVFWHRFLYLTSKSWPDKAWACICIYYRQLMDNIYNFYLSKHKRRNKQEILAFRHGISDAKKYIKSEEYKSLSSVYCE